MRVSVSGPLLLESDALPTALPGAPYWLKKGMNLVPSDNWNLLIKASVKKCLVALLVRNGNKIKICFDFERVRSIEEIKDLSLSSYLKM